MVAMDALVEGSPDKATPSFQEWQDLLASKKTRHRGRSTESWSSGGGRGAQSATGGPTGALGVAAPVDDPSSLGASAPQQLFQA
jgi:hypothetical protein